MVKKLLLEVMVSDCGKARLAHSDLPISANPKRIGSPKIITLVDSSLIREGEANVFHRLLDKVYACAPEEANAYSCTRDSCEGYSVALSPGGVLHNVAVQYFQLSDSSVKRVLKTSGLIR